MEIEFATFTDIGGRTHNEDNFCVARYQNSYCFAVADGLGGHGGGDVASRCAIEAVQRSFIKRGYYEALFSDVFAAAQAAILERQATVHTTQQMKTTLVLLVFHEGVFHWAHVGDSRLYYLKGARIKSRTLDHSVPQMLALAREIKEEEIRTHPDRNRLMRVLGIPGESVRFEVGTPVKWRRNQSFLLCSDGYWENLDAEDIERTRKAVMSPEAWIKDMNTVIQKKGPVPDADNATAICIMTKANGFWR